MASKESSASRQASPKAPTAASAKKVLSARASKKASPPAPVPLKTRGKTPGKALTPAPESATPTKAAKPVKLKKPKLIRDSFTIPKDEYAVIDALKLRAGQLSSSTKKSELIRAGIKALAAMEDGAFLGALQQVPVIKTGRPAKAKVG